MKGFKVSNEGKGEAITGWPACLIVVGILSIPFWLGIVVGMILG